MIEHKHRFLLIAILVPTLIVAIVALVLFGEGNELAERVLGWLEGAAVVLGPALVDAFVEKRKRDKEAVTPPSAGGS
jgi:hypothetical protein